MNTTEAVKIDVDKRLEYRLNGVVGYVIDDAVVHVCTYVDDSSDQHNVTFPAGKSGMVRRSTICYQCDPCTTRGMECKKTNRLDYYNFII